MEAYSLDLRNRVLVACDESGLTRQETADDLGVSRSFLQKLLRRSNQGQSIIPKRHSGGKKPTWQPAQDEIRRLVAAKPESTLIELCQALLASGGPTLRPWTMCRALQQMELTLKKSRCMPWNGIVRVW